MGVANAADQFAPPPRRGRGQRGQGQFPGRQALFGRGPAPGQEMFAEIGPEDELRDRVVDPVQVPPQGGDDRQDERPRG